MATPVHEAYYEGVPTKATYGTIQKNGRDVPYVCIVMRIPDGELAGHEFKFEVSKWDEKNNTFSFRNMKSCGWQGKTMATFVDDVRAAEKAGKKVRFMAKLAEWNGNSWWTADRMGGGTLVRTAAPATQDTTSMLDEMASEAAARDAEYQASRSSGGGGAAPPPSYNDAPPPSYNDAPPPSDDDLPF